LTKMEATTILEMRPIRFWQLTQQAIAGMTVGLLTQPRSRKGDLMAKSEQLEIKQLKAKVLELEKVTATQVQLIEILKSMPGCQGVTLKDAAKTKRVPERGQKKSGVKLSESSKGEPEASGKLTESKYTHSKELEEKPLKRI
jgi:hypothetical protein